MSLRAVPLRTPIAAFSLGEVHTLVLTSAGEVYSFGDNSFGAACNGSSPIDVHASEGGATATAATDAFSRCDLPLMEGERVTDVAAGSFHSLAFTSYGRVLGWGDSSHGQLGSERKDGYVYSLLQEAQSARVDNAEIEAQIEMASVIAEIALPLHAGENVTGVWTRSFHSAALTDAGRLIVWGDNVYGQIGAEPANETSVGDSQMATPLGPGTGFFADRVALGELHTLALDNASRLVSFGLNTRHQLGRMRGATWDALPVRRACATLSLLSPGPGLQSSFN